MYKLRSCEAPFRESKEPSMGKGSSILNDILDRDSDAIDVYPYLRRFELTFFFLSGSKFRMKILQKYILTCHCPA